MDVTRSNRRLNVTLTAAATVVDHELRRLTLGNASQVGTPSTRVQGNPEKHVVVHRPQR